jgi:gluconolactonase
MATDFPLVRPDEMGSFGDGLQRPECVLSLEDGGIIVSDLRGLTRIHPDGSISPEGRWLSDLPADDEARRLSRGQVSLTNGFARTASGEYLIADFGLGRVDRQGPDGQRRAWIEEVEGRPIGKANFVLADQQRCWITVSTYAEDWVGLLNLKQRPRDGYIALVVGDDVRIVADGLDFANECRVDPTGRWLYVAETFGRRVSRFEILPGGDLRALGVFGPSLLDGFPDGLAIDRYGNLWVALAAREQVIVITPSGRTVTVTDLGNTAAFARLEQAMVHACVTPEIIEACGWKQAAIITSVAFGGVAGDQVFLGNLGGHALPCFRNPITTTLS